MNRKAYFLKGAWLTISRLFGGLFLGLIAGTVLFHLLPGSDVEDPSVMHAAVASIPAIAGFLAAGAAWGMAIGQQLGHTDRRKFGIAGVLGFAPITSILVIGFGMLEQQIFAFVGPSVPIHRLFTILFTLSALLITGVSVFVLSRALGFPRRAGILALRAALAAAGAFLLVNLTMESLGWVVGAPRAAERATMLVVMLLGKLAAAFTAGGLFALDLFPEERPLQETRKAGIQPGL